MMLNFDVDVGVDGVDVDVMLLAVWYTVQVMVMSVIE